MTGVQTCALPISKGGFNYARQGTPTNAIDEYGDTALMIAAYRGHMPVVKALLVAGADATTVNARGQDAVMLAGLRRGDSESVARTQEEMGYMLIAENGHCGTRGQQLAGDVAGAADCAALAQGAGVEAFSLGTHYARGRCYAEGLDVTDGVVADFNKDRVNPPCPGGSWEADDL